MSLRTDDITDEGPPHEHPSLDESPVEEAAHQLTSFESINNVEALRPDTMGSLEVSRENTYQENTDDLMATPIVTHLLEDEEIVGGELEGNLPTITLADGIAILDEYFHISPTELQPLNGGEAPDDLPTSATDVTHQDFPFVPSTQPNAPGVLMAPRGACTDTVSEAPEILNPDQAMGGFEMVKSTSNAETVKSSCPSTNLTSSPSSETDNTEVDLPDVASHTSFVKRLVLDDAGQFLERVLIELENGCDDSRIPNSSVPGVVDEIIKSSDYTSFVKIMTGVTENWAKCNRLIVKPAVEAAQERLLELGCNRSNYTRMDQYQTNLNRGAQMKSERLKHAIDCLDIRMLSKIDL